MGAEKMIREVLGSQTNDKSVHAQALFKIITSVSEAEQADLLAIALAERDEVPKSPKALPNKGIDQDTWDRLVKTHSDMIDGHLKMAFFKTHECKNFAAEILRLIQFFQEDDEKVYAVAHALFSPYVPYHSLPGTPVHMSNMEYQHKLESDKRRVDLIEYVMELPFDEKTERASMLLQVVDDTDDKDLRVALLGHAFARLEKRILARLLR